MMETREERDEDKAQEEEQPAVVGEHAGFVSQLVRSIFEPGANAAVVMAMNVCFFLLILVLFALAVLTSWNKHVLFFMGVSTLLWFSMIWFVLELSKVQARPDNMPIIDTSQSDPGITPGDAKEDKKNR